MLASIIIPVRNEEESLPQLMAELNEVIREVSYDIEVIFVNDSSTDTSPELLESFKKKYPYIQIVHLSRRGGQTGCYQIAFQQALGKYIIRMDGDLQDDPQDLHKFFLLLEEDVDIVMGLRTLRRHKRILRFASILYDSFVVLLFDSPLHTNTSSFIAFKAKYIKGIVFKKNDHRHLPAIAMRRGASKIREVIVANRERIHGVSKYNNAKKIFLGVLEVVQFFLRVKTGFYDAPPVQGEET